MARKLLYAIAGAILIAGLTAAAIRGGGSDIGPMPTPTTTGSAASATVTTVGQKMPAFAGVSHDRRAIDSADLLARGPLILSFFRGHW